MQNPNSLYTGFDLSGGRKILDALKWALLVLIFIPFGVGATAIVTALVCAAMAYEWAYLSGGDAQDTNAVLAVAAAAGLPAFISFMAGPAAGVVAAILLIGVLFLMGEEQDAALNNIAPGVAAIGIGGALFVALRAIPEHGLVTAIWLLLIVWGAEAGGALAAQRYGEPKDFGPSLLSRPARLGGALVGGIFMGLLVMVAYRKGNPALVMLASMVAAIACLLADRIEPWMRQRVGNSDTVELPFGMESVLDRMGGLIGASIVTGLLFLAFGSPFGG